MSDYFIDVSSVARETLKSIYSEALLKSLQPNLVFDAFAGNRAVLYGPDGQLIWSNRWPRAGFTVEIKGRFNEA